MIRSAARKGLLTLQAVVCFPPVLAEGKFHCVLTAPDTVLRSDFGFAPRSDTDYLAIDASDRKSLCYSLFIGRMATSPIVQILFYSPIRRNYGNGLFGLT
jgi:hypothetical protein